MSNKKHYTLEEKKDKLANLHAVENILNKEASQIEKRLKGIPHLLKQLESRKKRIAKQVSNNMRMRNTLINEIKIEENKTK